MRKVARFASAILSPSKSLRIRVMKLHVVEFGGYLGQWGASEKDEEKTAFSVEPRIVHIDLKCVVISKET